MALHTDLLGRATEARTEVVDPDRALAYAAATNDDNPAYQSGKFAPPVFGVVPSWQALLEANAMVIPPDKMLMVVHGEQDMWFRQPLVPGMRLTTSAVGLNVRVGSSGSRFTAHITSRDDDGQPVLEIYGTTFVRGVSDGESAGPDKPDHAFPEAARDRKVGELTVHMDDDQTYRYHDASGDEMPIHLDDAVAKSVGLPGIIIHGLCTMAVCSQAVVKTVCDGDPSRLTRLAVRFAKNVFPGNDVTVTIYDAGDGGYAFEAHSNGDLVISNGRAEVGT